MWLSLSLYSSLADKGPRSLFVCLFVCLLSLLASNVKQTDIYSLRLTFLQAVVYVGVSIVAPEVTVTNANVTAVRTVELRDVRFPQR
jgi:hypothetical protein